MALNLEPCLEPATCYLLPVTVTAVPELAKELVLLDAIVCGLPSRLVLGLAALPIAFVLLRPLPDRGYAFAKVLGPSAGRLAGVHPRHGSGPAVRPHFLLICVLAVGGLSAWLPRRNGGELWTYLRTSLPRCAPAAM